MTQRRDVTLAKKPHGGQLTITPSKMSRCLQALAAGNYRKTAAAYAGISPNTLRNWEALGIQAVEEARMAGHDPDQLLELWFDEQRIEYSAKAPIFTAPGPPELAPTVDTWRCVLFAALLERAEAQAEVRAVTNVVEAGANQWQASMTYLERRYPDRWGRRERQSVEVTGAHGGPVQLQNVPGPDELVALVVSLRQEAQQREAATAAMRELPQ
jgi:hypothetical protein